MDYLFDTNIVIHYFNGLTDDDSIHEILARSFRISIVTTIEFLGWAKFAEFPDEFEKAKAFLSHAIVLPLDDSVAAETIRLRQRYRCRTPDAIIAATALVHGLRIVTNDANDFAKLGLPSYTVKLK